MEDNWKLADKKTTFRLARLEGCSFESLEIALMHKRQKAHPADYVIVITTLETSIFDPEGEAPA